MNNSKTSSINDGDIKKTTEYAKALATLDESLKSINGSLPSFADGVNAGLKAMAEKLPEVVNSMMKLNIQNKELEANGKKPISVFSQLASSFFSWNNLLQVGITLLTTYGGALVNWITGLIKGESSLSYLAKTMKDARLVTEALNKANSDGQANAQQELTHLGLLYKATRNHNLSLKERKQAVADLQQQYPEYFGNLKTEDFMAGKATQSYNKLTEAIIAAARARAAEDMIVKNQARRLNDEQQLKDLEVQKIKLEKELAEASKINKEINNTQILGSSSLTVGTGSKDTAGDAKINRLTTQLNSLKRIMSDLSGDTQIIDKRNEALTKSVTASIEKYGVKIVDGFKEYKLARSQESKTPLKALQKLDGFAINIAGDINAENELYEAELALLNKNLEQKLISQEEYEKQSIELKKQYHQNIGNQVEDFAKNQLTDAQKIQQDLLKGTGDILGKDADAVKKALLPGQKFEAEKKQIEDKYNFEMLKAAGNEEKRKQLAEQSQQEITELTKSYEQQRRDFAMQSAQQVSDAAFSILKNGIQGQSAARLKGLETQKAAELSNTSLTATQRKVIEDKYKKKEGEEKVRAFKAEQRASILQAVINGALAVTKATSQTGVLSAFVIPGIIAQTAIQVATIAAQKAPQYARGGLHFQSDGRGALLSGYSRTDDTNAFLRSGEAVVVSEAMRNPWARNLVSAINVAYGGRDFSTTGNGRGYAVGGIFTDGGNANRYYSQPVNDVKDLANTLAYQMMNNFPPIYVDVKDVNNQQNILAQTVNRVNL